ncbi:MAG: hypothetical protein COV45_05410 [Deltaproteobacteria bacterium CG11_big_fil_rev_8_21_14_0_20_47_16]|nr:MAG: hypothetical protein COV45_05410 [Deltaproteobacteria bacterium CG11_big_fil_rev_8_21_14_0_20_47_16]
MSGSGIAMRAVEGAGTGAMIGAECGGGYGAIIGGVIGLGVGIFGGVVESNQQDAVSDKQKKAGEKAIHQQQVSARITARNMAKQKAAAQTGMGDQLLRVASLERQESNDWQDIRSKGVVFTAKEESRAQSPVAPQFYGNATKVA